MAPGEWRRVVAPEPPSQVFQALRHTDNVDEYGMRFEVWENDRYIVSVRRFKKGFFIKNAPYMILGIGNQDESAAHDWRDFQAIKNDLCGRDWEGIELYPSESRLKDPSNRFYLWCVPGGILKFGLPGGRIVLNSYEAMAPQRPFPNEREA